MVLRGRGKLAFINGQSPKPETSDPKYSAWELNNSLVMSWLINSMEPHISRTCLFLRTAKAIWDAVQEHYSDLENASQVFEIKNKLKDIRQESMSITEYYNTLQTLWQELDLHYEADWGDLEGNIKFKEHLEKERLYEFLAGLNRELDEVRGRVLGRRPLPSLSEAFAEVRREESHRRVMLGERRDSHLLVPAGDSSALLVKSASSRPNNRPRCSHCNKLGHTQDKCWHLHGKPSDIRPKRSPSSQGRSFTAVAVGGAPVDSPGSTTLNQAQIDQLLALLKSQTELSGTVNFVET